MAIRAPDGAYKQFLSGSGDGDDCDDDGECEDDGGSDYYFSQMSAMMTVNVNKMVVTGSDYYAVFLIDECDDDGDGVDARGL